MDCNDDVDALETLRLHIDQELLDISFLSDGESLGRRELKKTSSAPDLRNLNVCAVDDLSQGSVGAVHSGVTQRSNDPRTNLKQSKEWLETFL